jgi:hypothetical protein
MTEFNIRADGVDVEQIMRAIRARIREKRGVDYTEEEIRQLASVRLEKFLEPSGVRSDLLEQFHHRQTAPPAPLPNYAFEDDTLFTSHRAVVRWMRRLLKPVLKLFFNPGPLSQVLHLQAQINTRVAQELDEQRNKRGALYFEVLHNLVLEVTKLGIEVKNLRMRVESMSSRLDFDERRARALEGAVQYRPGAAAPESATPGAAAPPASEGQEERRRRRRRRRRRGGQGHGGQGRGASEAAPSEVREGSAGAVPAPGDRAPEGPGSEGPAGGQDP